MPVVRRQLDEFERGKIFGLHLGGHSATEISTILNVPRTTIQTVIKNHRPLANTRTGRPPELTERAERRVLLELRKNPKITYQKLRRTLDLKISARTIRRIAHKHGIRKWLQKKRPFLTPKQAKVRYKWALEHKDQSQEDQSRIIQSDECSIERGSGNRRQQVWRIPSQKWDKDMIMPSKTGKDISIMVWAAIFGDQKGNVYILERDFESKKHGYSANSYI